MTDSNPIIPPDMFERDIPDETHIGPSEGITEESFAQGVRASLPAEPSFAPSQPQPQTMDELTRQQQILHQVEKLEYRHTPRTTTGEQGLLFSGVNHEQLARAQGQFVMEQSWFYQQMGRRNLTDDQYVDLLKRFNHEQATFIRALMTALHQAGVL